MDTVATPYYNICQLYYINVSNVGHLKFIQCYMSNIFQLKVGVHGTFLVVHLLRLCAPKAGGLSSIPGQGTRSHMPQLRVYMLHLGVWMQPLKIPHTTTKRSFMLQ